MSNSIENFLDKYDQDENSDYAVLIKGKWGHGKTFAIDKYINDVPDWIKISLFGKNSISSVKEEIFFASVVF
jgi:hypothetical protein